VCALNCYDKIIISLLVGNFIEFNYLYIYKTEIKQKRKSLLRFGFETSYPIVMQFFLNERGYHGEGFRHKFSSIKLINN